MCDFTAGGLLGNELDLLVIELKGGAADQGALDQLQEGLNLIRKQLGSSVKSVKPRAYLVAAKQTAQLKSLLRSKKRRLQFGSSTLEVRVCRCGDSVTLRD